MTMVVANSLLRLHRELKEFLLDKMKIAVHQWNEVESDLLKLSRASLQRSLFILQDKIREFLVEKNLITGPEWEEHLVPLLMEWGKLETYANGHLNADVPNDAVLGDWEIAWDMIA